MTMSPGVRVRRPVGAARKRGPTAAQPGDKPQTADGASASTIHDHLTPLDVMLATMRWAHEAAEAADTRAAGLVGKEAIDAAKTVAGLRALARDTAKHVAPYVHTRLATPKRGSEPGLAHEDALAALEKAVREDPDARVTASARASEARDPESK
jgi:hypothetical protein